MSQCMSEKTFMKQRERSEVAIMMCRRLNDQLAKERRDPWKIKSIVAQADQTTSLKGTCCERNARFVCHVQALMLP